MQNTNNKAPDLKLPFRPHKQDAGQWAYDHRVALCITVIIFLITAIIVVSTNISIGGSRVFEGMFVELLPEPEPKLEEQQKLKLMEQMDFSNVKNLVSNENATKELNEKLADDRGTQAEDIYNEAKAVQDRIRSNKAAYDKGLKEEQDLIDAKDKKSETLKREDSKVKGKVTVSFSFTNPVRQSSRLVIPAYMCEGGGEVVLNVVLNHNGSVTSASVDRSQSTSDNCMNTTAINAAKGSRFNIDSSAPDKHQGTITYIFIPQ